jgi:hypothetical protein
MAFDRQQNIVEALWMAKKARSTTIEIRKEAQQHTLEHKSVNY